MAKNCFRLVFSAFCALSVASSACGAVDWTKAKVNVPKSNAIYVDLQDGTKPIRIDIQPHKSRLAPKLPYALTPEGIELDLPAVFAAGATMVSIQQEVADLGAIADRDVLFAAELIGNPAKKLATVEVRASGTLLPKREEKFTLLMPKSKHFPSMAEPVVPGRSTYTLTAVVPKNVAELRMRVEFAEPGDGKVVFCGTRAEPNVGEDAEKPGVQKVLFHATFDDTLAPVTAAGGKKPIVSQGLTFVEGREGKALHFEPKGVSRLVYPAKGNLNPVRGTMTCWYRHALPVSEPHMLFAFGAGKDGKDGDGHLELGWQKYRGPGIIQWGRGDYLKFSRRFGPQSRPVQTNGWVQLTVVWDERHVTAYANGDTIPPGRSADAENPLGEAFIGPRPFRFASGWQDAISLLHLGCGLSRGASWSGDLDDVRIWSEPFSRQDAAEFYRKAAGVAVSGDEHGKEPWRDPKTPPPANRALMPPTGEPGNPANLELVEEVFPARLAKSGEKDRFLATGEWTVGTCEGLEYLEAGKGLYDRFAVRFRVDGAVPLWCFEVTYPDDKARAIDLVVQGVNGDGGYSLNHGIETGLEHPLTMRNATKRYLFWRARVFKDAAQNGDLALVAMTQTKDNPAAISRIRVYAIRDGKIPSAGIVPAPAVNGLRRHSAIWLEDPAIHGDFGVQGADYGVADYSLLIDRISAYMKYTGQDMLIYPAVWYNGIIGPNYMPRPHAPHFMREFCRRFERDGHVFVASINQQRLPQLGLKLTRRQLADGSLHATPVSVLDTGLPNWGGWHHSPTYFNISHPDVQKAILDEIASVCRECRDHASFGGMAIDPFNSVNFTSWGTIAAGYNDYTIEAFEKATGIRVPVDRTHPMRGREYAAWLKANAYDRWVQFRCDVLTDFYRRCVETVRASRPDLMLYIRAAMNWRTIHNHPDLFRPDFPNRMLRESGIDCAALAKIEGLSIAPYSMPAYWHDELKSQPVPQETREYVRDLAEADGYLSLPLTSYYPFADFHDSYYETAVGAPKGSGHYKGDGRLCGSWLKEKQWRVTHFSASGREALRPYAKALRCGDVFAFGRGGFSLGTCGDEAVMAPFMKAFLALPAVKFADVKGFSHPDVRFRTAQALGKTWHYLVNTGSEAVQADVSLPAGATDAVSGKPVAGSVPLAAYEFRAFVTK